VTTNGKPLPPASRPPPDSAGETGEIPTCVHCGEWDGMELITFPDKKTGQTRRAFKCQSCDKWHYPRKK